MILILWALMVLLVKLTSRPEKTEAAAEEVIVIEEVVTPAPLAVEDNEAPRLAAAIAAAYALQLASQASEAGIPTDTSVNNWASAGRVKQVTRNIDRGRN